MNMHINLPAPIRSVAELLAHNNKARKAKWAKLARGIVDPEETRPCHDFKPPAEEAKEHRGVDITMSAKLAIRNAQMLADWINGMPADVIAEKAGVTARQVRKLAGQHGWPPREDNVKILCDKYEAWLREGGWHGTVTPSNGCGWITVKSRGQRAYKIRAGEAARRMRGV